jgi:hypothetical protein
MSSKKSSVADLEAELDAYYNKKTYGASKRNEEERKRLKDLLGL